MKFLLVAFSINEFTFSALFLPYLHIILFFFFLLLIVYAIETFKVSSSLSLRLSFWVKKRRKNFFHLFNLLGKKNPKFNTDAPFPVPGTFLAFFVLCREGRDGVPQLVTLSRIPLLLLLLFCRPLSTELIII